MNGIKTVEFHCAPAERHNGDSRLLLQAGPVHGYIQVLHVLDEAFWDDSDVMLATLDPFVRLFDGVLRVNVLECNLHVPRIRPASLVLVAALSTLVNRPVPVWACSGPDRTHRGKYDPDTVYDLSVRI